MKVNKILIADSQVLSSEGIRYLLTKHFKHSLSSVVTSKENLLEFLDKQTPSLLIIDPFKLEGLFPREFTHIAERHPVSRTLVISGNITRESVTLIMDAGITHFITKDCSEIDLLAAFESFEHNENYFGEDIRNILANKKNSENEVKATLLTKKEIEIIRLIAQGLTTKEISTHEFLSAHTINTHRKNIFRKLNINNTSELVMFAIKTGIVDVTEYYI